MVYDNTYATSTGITMKIGIIGVGVIGKLLVDRVEETDHSAVVYDIDQS